MTVVDRCVFLAEELGGIFRARCGGLGVVALAVAGLSSAPLPGHAADAPRTIIVLDASGSMWGQIDGRPKLEIARETVAKVVGSLPGDRELGLIAYGHRTKGSCTDIELLVPPGKGTGPAILDAVNSMRFLGKTPLSEAVRQAAQSLRFTEDAATVVLVTDGLETCNADPCALGNELERSGVDFTAHVIGFGLTRDEGAKVACLAQNTGGRYFEARDADSLAEALSETVAQAPAAPPPAPVTPPARYFPGREMMADMALTPTGGDTGKEAPEPTEAAFPGEGTVAQCKAICDADAACGSWRYEPRGSLFVDHARCFVYSANTAFAPAMMDPAEGWASGMKPGVLGLTRPYVPLGASSAASLSPVETGTIAPGTEFRVRWKGPAGTGDWVDLVPVGQEDLSGELAHFYVEQSLDPGGALEGEGTLPAPGEAGHYELRYVLGREVDRRVLARVPVTIGQTSVSQDTTPPASGMARPVSVTFEAGKGDLELYVSWSAVPVPGQNLPPEAWAAPEAVSEAITAELLPGSYEVRGDAGDSVFFQKVTVTEGGPTHFVIPVSKELSPAGEDETAAPGGDAANGFTCDRTVACQIEDKASGLAFVLPAGWKTDAPFFARTAGGVTAAQPTMTITDDVPHTIVLNPLKWLESNGSCLDTMAGKLCLMLPASESAQTAFSVVAGSIRLDPPR